MTMRCTETIIAAAFVGVLLWGASPVAACPYCESDVGQAVAAGIFNDDFWSNALLTLLPLVLLAAIVALLHFGLPGADWLAGSGRGRGVRSTETPRREEPSP